MVGYVMGKNLIFCILKLLQIDHGNLKGSLKIFSRDNGVFVFKFSLEDDLGRVIKGRLWLLDVYW